MACNDSTGKALVADGNGYYIGYYEGFKTVHEEGNVRSGLKDGTWKTHNPQIVNLPTQDSVINTEEYDNGKFIKGWWFDLNGKEVVYLEKEREAQYPGGLQAFYAYLGRHITYPDEARRKNVTGKVYIKFIVERDGSLSDVAVIRSPDPELGEEALRVVKSSPKWVAGMQDGRTVRSYFTVPINFTLGSIN
jgi:TonB family protein